LGACAAKELAGRGVEIHVGTSLERIDAGRAFLSNGTEFDTETLVWTTGVRPNPLVGALGLPLDERGRVEVDEYLKVSERIWALGDCARVPNLATPDAPDPPTQQHALRQARRLAKNLAGEPQPYRYRMLGQVATLGRYKGVADVLGLRLRGFPAWLVTRTYHLYQLPLPSRKLHVVVGAEDDVRLDSEPAHGVLEQAVAAALAEADQRHAFEIRHAFERRVGMRDQQVVVRDDLDGFERPLGNREHDEGEVELPPFDELEQVHVVVPLRQADLHLRPLGRELLDERRKHPRGHALERADAQRPRLARDKGLEVGLRCGEAGLDRLDVAEEERAGGGQLDRLGPAAALEQPRADDALETRDLLADGGLRVPELGRGLGERGHPRHGLERRQMPQIESRPTINAIYQLA